MHKYPIGGSCRPLFDGKAGELVGDVGLTIFLTRMAKVCRTLPDGDRRVSSTKAQGARCTTLLSGSGLRH